MKIAICDDEKAFREEIKKYCERYAEQYGMDIEIKMFCSGEEVLQYEERVDLLFLDIEMDGIDGISVMERMTDRNNIWKIAFVTAHEQYMQNAFGIKTVGFVKKPIRYNEIGRNMYMVWRELKEGCFIKLRGYHGEEYKSEIVLFTADILYIRGEKNCIHIYTDNEKIRTNESLNGIEAKLKATPMFRIHKSYMVNFEKVRRFTRGYVIMENEVELPVGRTRINEARKRYIEYQTKQIKKSF